MRTEHPLLLRAEKYCFAEWSRPRYSSHGPNTEKGTWASGFLPAPSKGAKHLSAGRGRLTAGSAG